MITRRSFFARASAGAGMLLLAGTNAACWFSSTVFTNIANYINIGLTAFQAVTFLVPGLTPAVQLIIALVKAGFADLQLAVQDYNNAPASQKTTLLGRISVVLANLQNEIQNFWANLHIPNEGLAALIQGLLALILSTLAGFAAQLPAPVGVAKRSFAKPIPVTPVKRSAKQFKEEFNAALVAAGKPALKF